MERIELGMTVYSADGERLGKVTERNEKTFVIESGFFFHKEYLASLDEVDRIAGSDVYLGRRADDLRGTEGATAEARAPSETRATEEGRMPLAEEEAVPEKRTREAGHVRVQKETVTEEKQFTVPVRHEEVHVETAPVEGEPRPASEGAFEPKEIDVPLHEDEVEIRKRPVVKEEVRVSKEAHEEEEEHGATIRKEVAHVEKSGTASTDEEEHPIP